MQEGEQLTPADASGFGLNVSPLIRNGAEEGIHMRKVFLFKDCLFKHLPQKRMFCHHVLYSPSCSSKPKLSFFLHQVDYRSLIPDAVKGAANDSVLPCTDFSVGQLYVSFRFKATEALLEAAVIENNSETSLILLSDRSIC